MTPRRRGGSGGGRRRSGGRLGASAGARRRVGRRPAAHRRVRPRRPAARRRRLRRRAAHRARRRVAVVARLIEAELLAARGRRVERRQHAGRGGVADRRQDRRRGGVGRRLAGALAGLVEAQHDDGDVVVAALVLGLADELAGDPPGVVDRRQDGRERLLGDHRVEAVAAEHDGVAGPQLERARVDLDPRLGAQGPAQDAAVRVRQGRLGREVAGAHHLADQGVVVGDLLEPLVAPEVQAAVADVGELEAVVAEQRRRERGAHAGVGPVGARALIDAGVGGEGGVGQVDAGAFVGVAADVCAAAGVCVGFDAGASAGVGAVVGVGAGGQGFDERLEGQVRGDLAGLRPAHAVGHRKERRLGDEGVLVGRAVQADVGQRRVSGDEAHAPVTPRSGRSSRRCAVRCRA